MINAFSKYTAAVPLNHEKIGTHPQTISKIKIL